MGECGNARMRECKNAGMQECGNGRMFGLDFIISSLMHSRIRLSHQVIYKKEEDQIDPKGVEEVPIYCKQA